jgi:hypothetical protein
MKRSLEEKQAEKERLGKAYMARKRQQWAELVAKEPRIASFKKAVRREQDPAALLVALADSWVRSAPADTRYAALRIIDAHAVRMALRAGRQGLDDPIPPARNVFLTAREMLAVR